MVKYGHKQHQEKILTEGNKHGVAYGTSNGTIFLYGWQ